MSITPNGAAERAGVLAAGQHGLVTAAQLQAIGVPRRTRENWLRRGVLLRAARRVYVFAHHT
ncbi:type IV toxin-antitoxin system AbiEi family antitoxin domain-containing protein [Conexibacter sp. S30A1]|uniref:type IV toxin-antitoxin system AbiEi family antitoxin domain-containing protein n=1 Tax=Conexibacter sp. S30A1 TaxID=2937800 RepID=UPI00200D5A64|nr:type IV toxin-antitoxin system AbiEi family antitoxin domain-containing protein [Conexibacter sp. S30A1]